jgi:hypothetical protein
MECWRTGVQIPPAPPNTGGCLAHARPLETSIYAGSSSSPTFPYMVSDGLKRSPLGHKSGTSGTDSAQLLSPAEQATLRTKHLGTRECHLFRKEIFEGHPHLSLSMASSYLEIAKDKGYIQANQNLLAINDRLIIKDLNLSATPEILKKFAIEKALYVTTLAESFNGDHGLAYEACCEYIKGYGLTPPKPQQRDDFISACIARMGCPRWWKKKVFSKQRRTIEAIARDLGMVHKNKSAYSSTFTQAQRAHQRALAKAFLENTFLVNDYQQVFSLKELSDTSVSNPEIRRAELMTRISGFEIVADELGHCGEFYTITTPSRMHARINKTGRQNSKYDGTNPRDANEYLGNLWAKIRAKLHRENLNVYGFRVAEPNHDGTPHWHLLLFMKPSIKSRVRSIMKHYALEDSRQEKGANQHRFKAVAIDKSKGSAAGYIAKYITKNIDGSNIDADLYGNDAKQSAKAIDAWSSCWGIRQFQQIGGPSVTVWRELRRTPACDIDVDDIDNNAVISEAACAAVASDWAAYVMVMGGVEMRKSEHPIRPFYEQPVYVNQETGELIEDGLTAYGDPKKPRIRGLDYFNQAIITRLHNWKKYEDAGGSSLAPRAGTSTTAAKPPAPTAGRPWTSINNCTQPKIH